MKWLTAVGGTLLVISVSTLCHRFVNLAFFAPKGNEEFPIAEELNPTQQTPNWLENWKLWIGIVFALIFIAYTLPIIDIINNSPPGSSGFKYW